MAKARQRDIRRLAMQALYQMDLRGPEDMDDIAAAVAEAPGAQAAAEPAMELAQAAWAGHQEADAQVAQVAPEWPTHRQPPVDRAILRLAYHEITSGRTPMTVAINEAVELAKTFGAKDSPNFVNAVLDRLAKQSPRIPPEGSQPPAPQKKGSAPSADAWLSDALHEEERQEDKQ